LWVTQSAFALPAVNTHGNAGPDVLRGPGSTNYDANIVRKFQVRGLAKSGASLRGGQRHEPPALGYSGAAGGAGDIWAKQAARRRSARG